MAYDEDLAGRTRELLAELTDFDERKMFGGLAFMVNTHMACGIVHDDLMVRVGKANHDAAINAGATEMDFTGRPMRGMVIVPANRVRRDGDLEPWVSNPLSSRDRSQRRSPMGDMVTATLDDTWGNLIQVSNPAGARMTTPTPWMPQDASQGDGPNLTPMAER